MSYEPENFRGGSQEEIIAWVFNEFIKLKAALQAKLDLQASFKTEPPARVKDGLIAAADGVNWDPGARKGIYLYRDGSWHKLD